MIVDKFRTISEAKLYYKGVKEGLWRYAWQRDGVYYVGTTGRTLKEAQAQIDQELASVIKTLNEYL